MKKCFAVSVALLLLVILPVSVVLAQETVPVEKGKASCQKEMKLTDEQKAKLEELKIEHRMKAIDLRAEQAKLALMLKKEWMKPDPSGVELENLVKQLSAVREKLQISGIQHALALRKLLGPEWRMHMRVGMGGEGMGGCCEMMDEPGMGMPGGGECCPMMGTMGFPMASEDEGCGAGGKRIVLKLRQDPGEGSACMMHEGCKGPCMMKGMEGMKGGCMMQQPGMGAGCGMGAMKGACMKGEGGRSCCPSRVNKWNSRMFRPFGRKMGPAMGGCMMKKTCTGAGAGATMGGCMMQKGEGCKKAEASKEGTCPLKMKKEIEKKAEKKE